MATGDPAEQEKIVKNYREQISFYNQNRVKIKVIAKQTRLLYSYFSQSLDLDEIIELKQHKQMLIELSDFSGVFLALDKTRLIEPLAEADTEAQYHAIVQTTPRGKHVFFNIKRANVIIKEFEEFYKEILARFLKPYMNRAYKETIIEDIYYVQVANKLQIAKLALLGDELTVETIEYRDKGSDDREVIYKADSFHDFIVNYSSHKDYTYETGDEALDKFIQNNIPHLAI